MNLFLQINVAIVPLVIYIVSFLTSLVMQRLIKKYGRKVSSAYVILCTQFLKKSSIRKVYCCIIFVWQSQYCYNSQATFAIGEACTIAACVWMFFITPSTHNQVYPAAILLGMGLCTLQIRSSSMLTDITGSPVVRIFFSLQIHLIFLWFKVCFGLRFRRNPNVHFSRIVPIFQNNQP